MGMSIRTNRGSNTSCRNLKRSSRKNEGILEKLASGYQINRAADDASGLGITEKMRTQITALMQDSDNCENGISLVQTAEGYLCEVHDMLDRMYELSIRAGDGIFENSEREMIQEEVEQLKSEIDRISETANFNGNHLFRGETIKMTLSQSVDDLDMPNLDLNIDLSIIGEPFRSGANANQHHFGTIVKHKETGKIQQYRLIYADGDTSYSSVRITDENGQKTTVDFRNIVPSEPTYDSATGEYTRTYQITSDISCTETVKLQDISDAEKAYALSYKFQNNGSENKKIEFMCNIDTAYNEDDYCEEYFSDGSKIEKKCIYSKPTSQLTQGISSSYIKTNFPNSVSIINSRDVLPFSEKYTFTNDPDSISIGEYWNVDKWDYYTQNSLNQELGKQAYDTDLAMSIYWNDDMAAGSSKTYGYKCGVVRVDADRNLNLNLNINKEMPLKPIMIQSGLPSDDRIYISRHKMNTTKLGIRGVSMLSVESANESMDKIKNAINEVSMMRAVMGAQQNRLEYTVNDINTTAENLSAAKSRIKDTDMAKQMMEYTQNNVLMQSAQSMLAQANTQPQSVLQLLQ